MSVLTRLLASSPLAARPVALTSAEAALVDSLLLVAVRLAEFEADNDVSPLIVSVESTRYA